MDNQQTNQTADEPRALVRIDGAPTPASLVMLALERGTSVEQLERLMALQERWEANEARKGYVKSMAAFKADQPRIFKDKLVDYQPKGGGRVKYSFATLATVVRETAGLLGKYGLSAAWETQQAEKGMITVTCQITHEKGHRETVTLAAQPDASGSKNAIQAVGSTVSYLERYTLLAALGLATEEQDDADQPGWSSDARKTDAPEAAPRDTTPQTNGNGAGRAQKVIASFKALGVLLPELELFAGNFEHPLPAAEWGEPQYQAFTDAKDKIRAAPIERQRDAIREIFQLGPGAEG